MLNMTRWTPWNELAGLHRDLDSIFDRAWRDTGDRSRDASLSGFSPAADVRRAGDRWLVSLALPGVAPDKVDIDVVGRTLRVRGERFADAKGEPVLTEIRTGRFEREFTLSDEIDAAHVEATYRHGMLELVLPLSEHAKPHRITVKAEAGARQLVNA
jgi:HSP20 family protein